MIQIAAQMKILVAIEPVDGRKSTLWSDYVGRSSCLIRSRVMSSYSAAAGQPPYASSVMTYVQFSVMCSQDPKAAMAWTTGEFDCTLFKGSPATATRSRFFARRLFES